MGRLKRRELRRERASESLSNTLHGARKRARHVLAEIRQEKKGEETRLAILRGTLREAAKAMERMRGRWRSALERKRARKARMLWNANKKVEAFTHALRTLQVNLAKRKAEDAK